MKNKAPLILLLTLSMTNVFSQERFDQGYIKFYYSGDQTKPYPRILLYLPGSNEPLTDTIYTHKLEITRESFQVIREAIEQKKSISLDSLLMGSNAYQFIISNKGETTIFLTPFLPRIRQIINIIISQLNNMDNAIVIKNQLKSVIDRVMYDNKLNR